MSNIALTGNASGTGTFTLAAPNSSTDRTLTLPDEAGTVLTGASDIEAQVKTATNATGSAPIYACRAWVNFNGTGTVAIRESGNVSSVTDNGTGDYTVNFTTAMPDANYASPTCSDSTIISQLGSVATKVKSTTNININTAVVVGVPGISARTLFDLAEVNVAIFR